MKSQFSLVILVFSCLLAQTSLAQYDSLYLPNNDTMVGEIKKMDKGVLTIETPYSDQDFKVEWDKIEAIYTANYLMITLRSGQEYRGKIRTKKDSLINIATEGGASFNTVMNDIVYINLVKSRFSDRFSASISIGIDVTKAKNLRSISTRSTLGYNANMWSTDFSYNTLQSRQDDVDKIERSDGLFNFRTNFPKKWYLISTVSFLSNTEQQLDRRYNIQLGVGNFIIRNNKSYWGAKFGANLNSEKFTEDTSTRKSWEGYLGTELDIYDVGDLNLLMVIMGYYGITERGRWRSDLKLDIKYDLPLDFFIKLGFSLNYDNRPVENAAALDYVFNTTFGWEW